MRQRISEFPALMNGTRRLRRSVTRNSPWKRKLLEQLLQAIFILRDVRIELGVASLQVTVRNHSRTTMARARYVDDVQAILLNEAVEVHIDEIQTGSSTEVPEQAWLDVLFAQRFAQERILVEINLSHRQVVGGSPIRIHLAKFFGAKSFGYDNVVCFGRNGGGHEESSVAGFQGAAGFAGRIRTNRPNSKILVDLFPVRTTFLRTVYPQTKKGIAQARCNAVDRFGPAKETARGLGKNSSPRPFVAKERWFRSSLLRRTRSPGAIRGRRPPIPVPAASCWVVDWWCCWGRPA